MPSSAQELRELRNRAELLNNPAQLAALKKQASTCNMLQPTLVGTEVR